MTLREQFPTIAVKIANVSLVAGTVTSSLVVLYFLYHYAWTGERQLAGWKGVALYGVFPIVCSLLLGASLHLRPAYKVALAKLGFILTVPLYVAELLLPDPASNRPILSDVLASKDKTKEMGRLTEQFGVDIDTRDDLEVIADFRSRGIEAVPQVVLPTFARENGATKSAIWIDGVEVMPLSGVADKTTVVCNQNGQYLTYKSDERGFHNPRGIWRSSRIDIAAVGNSFTMGYCVDSDKNFVALIRERYPATLNAGMAGEGPLYILAVLKEYLRHVKPKLVLWFYWEGNNLAELQEEKKSSLLMRYLDDNFEQGLIGRQSDLDRALGDYTEKELGRRIVQQHNRWDLAVSGWRDSIKLTKLRQKLGLVYGTNAGELHSRDESQNETLDLFQKILAKAKRRVGAWGGQIYFVYLPALDRYKYNNPRYLTEQRAQILSYVESLGLPIMDLHPIFQAHSDPLSLFPFRGPIHYNAKGHRLVAEKVIEALQRGEFFSPEQ
jgi:hypothetical protein